MPIANIDTWLSLPGLPGLVPIESAIGKAWLALHRNDYDSVIFNVRLGSGTPMPPGTPDYILKAVKASTTKRSDIIAFRNGSVTIVEIKDRIGLGALGQLQGYQHLYLQDNPATGHIDLVAAGLTIQADIEPIFRNSGIKIELFPGVSV